MCREAHEFRGELIDLCAHVEHWLSRTLERCDPKPARARKPYLFGQKIKAVTDLVATQPEIFSKPARVADLLDQFQPFARLRSELAHATVNVITGKETLFVFNGVGSHPLGAAGRHWLTSTEAKTTIAALTSLSKHICDQKLRP